MSLVFLVLLAAVLVLALVTAGAVIALVVWLVRRTDRTPQDGSAGTRPSGVVQD
jgi:hypothetical protein